MPYFKRNNEIVEKVENSVKATGNGFFLTEDERNSILGLVQRYKDNTYKEWSDKDEFNASVLIDMVNDTSFNHKELAKKMANNHPTLQQNFMRLCLSFIKEMASKEYYDGRNESSVKVAKEIVTNFGDDYLPYI